MKNLVLLSLFFVMTACNNNKSKYAKAADEIAAQLPPENGHMNAGKEHYTVDVPAGWTTNHKTAYGVDYYFLLAPKTQDDPNTSVNIVSESMRHLHLGDYTTATIASIKKAIPSANITGQGLMVVDGIEITWFSYTMEVQNIPAAIVTYIIPKNDVAYILTGGTQTKDAQRYRKVFDAVVQSFRFDNK